MPFARKSAKPRPFLNETGLYDYAVKALGARCAPRPSCAADAKARGGRASRAQAAIATVLIRPQGLRLSHDAAFAETYAACAKRTRSWASGVSRRI